LSKKTIGHLSKKTVGHLSNKKITHLSENKIRHLSDAPARFLHYTGVNKTEHLMKHLNETLEQGGSK